MLIQRFGFNVSFADLALIGAVAVSLLFWNVPETEGDPTASPDDEAQQTLRHRSCHLKRSRVIKPNAAA